MSDSLKIDCSEWWGAYGEQDISEICRCSIGISVGEHWLTRLEDSWGNTVRNRLNASAYTLAGWFAGNWWRLRWEPETPNSMTDVDWRMSHSMATAGDGYCWPSILFASDGDSIAVASRATQGRVLGPVRYLNEINARISAKDFEREIDSFMTLVLSRLHSEGHGNSELAELWRELILERNDPKLTQWRRLEAICGYDAGEAPESLIELLVDDRFQLGRHAMEEVAAHSRHQTAKALEQIQDLNAAKGKQKLGGFRCKPQALTKKPRNLAGMRPWQRGQSLAQAAREEWNLGDKLIDNMTLAGLLQTSASAFKDHSAKAVTPMPLALRHTDGEKADIYVGSSWGTTRRFAACRVLGHWLDHSGKTEKLIPASEAKTADQQLQRAFAQEFLCPFNALLERLGTSYPRPEAIEEAAAHFGVSPLAVRTTLVNRGEMDRETLSWAACTPIPEAAV